MIDVIANFYGWTQIVTISEDAHRYGNFSLLVARPLSLHAVSDEIEARVAKRDMITFRRTRESFNGMPVYREERDLR